MDCAELESLWYTFKKNHTYLEQTYGTSYTGKMLKLDKQTIPNLKGKIAYQREFVKVQEDNEPR